MSEMVVIHGLIVICVVFYILVREVLGTDDVQGYAEAFSTKLNSFSFLACGFSLASSGL